MAPVRGWIKRAERLLEGHEETPVHAWLAVVQSYERLLSGDFQRARHWARHAIAVGATCDPAAAAIGRVAEARSLILEGEVQQGLGLLDEAGVVTVSGELDPLSTGIVYCELVCALQGLAQYDLAEEWTEAMERWRHGQPVGSIHGRCRVHRAEILRLRGFCREAEQEALLACEELRPYLRREFGWPLTELGRIRLRRGDIEGADEAFRAAHAVGWDPQPGLALVHLARGDVALAGESIRGALEHPLSVPSKELPPHTELRRAPLLEAQVEIAVAAGALDGGPRGSRRPRAHRRVVPKQGARCRRGARARTGRAGRQVTRRAPAVTSTRPRRSGTRLARPMRRRSLGWGWHTRTAPRATRSVACLEFRRRPRGLRAGRRRGSGGRSRPGVRHCGTWRRATA